MLTFDETFSEMTFWDPFDSHSYTLSGRTSPKELQEYFGIKSSFFFLLFSFFFTSLKTAEAKGGMKFNGNYLALTLILCIFKKLYLGRAKICWKRKTSQQKRIWWQNRSSNRRQETKRTERKKKLSSFGRICRMCPKCWLATARSLKRLTSL